MVVVHIVESFAGGTFDFLSNLINGLPKSYKHIIIYGVRRETLLDYKKYFPQNTEFVFWENAKREISIVDDLKAFNTLLSEIRKIKQIDIIHCHSSKAGFLGRLVAKSIGKEDKTIYTPHGVAFLRKDVSDFKKNFYKICEKLVSGFCNKIICCSDGEREAFSDAGIKNLKTIFNGVKVVDSSSSYQEKQCFTIATMGRITLQKNPELFNSIASRYLDYANIRFMWIGDGEEKSSLQSPNIQITGWLTSQLAEKELMKADVYLSTSAWEGLPLAVLTAMSMTKPLVLSQCSGNNDISSGRDILTFNTADEAIEKLNLLMNDELFREEYGRYVQKVFQDNFTVEIMNSKYKELYQELVKV